MRAYRHLTMAARALVVDDEPIIRDLLQDLLLEAGFDVRCASSGLIALNMLAEWPPDVILLDLMMPVMDGFAFARACGPAHRGSRPGIIVMSAAMDTQAAAKKLGVSGWIQKPFDVEEMLGLVAGYLPAHPFGGVGASNSSPE
jgi:two-component system, chemotaxis family, chemotaxis protein CheY